MDNKTLEALRAAAITFGRQDIVSQCDSALSGKLETSPFKPVIVANLQHHVNLWSLK